MAETSVRAVLIDGLKNAYALEGQALTINSRQVERLQNYPDLEARLRRHIDETKVQQQRLERCLAHFNESPSAVKEGMLKLTANMQAMVCMPPPRTRC